MFWLVMKVVLFVRGFGKYGSEESSILYVDSGVKKINGFIGNLIRKFNGGVLAVEVRYKVFELFFSACPN